MARASHSERIHRINAAYQLHQQNVAFAEAVEVLAKRFGVGRRH